jgi:glycosyltransferase involved in cell wall biosynthesis
VRDRPEISVVIPTRNRRGLLSRAALRSALSQEEVDHEVIVVDDGSTDDTSAWLRELGEPRLRVVRLEERRGVAAARNAGIDAARGVWVAFLDDDDLWSPRKLRRQLDTAAAASADFVYARVVSVDEMGCARYAFPLPDPMELPSKLLAASVLPAGCSNVIVRRELVRNVGGFDEELFQLSDWDLWIRLAWAGRAAACEDTLVGYLEHNENMLLSDPRDVTRELAYLDLKHHTLRNEHRAELDSRTFAHWVAWGHLRRGRRIRAARVFARSGLENRSPRDVALAAAFVLRAALPLSSARPILQRIGRHGAGTLPPPAPAWLELYR